MKMLVKSFKQQAIDFFYPNGGWAGWVRFFDPDVSTRATKHTNHDLFVGLFGESYGGGNVKVATTEERVFALERAIKVFQEPHWKDVYAKYVSGPIGEVECYPTNAARQAVELLKQATCEVELGL